LITGFNLYYCKWAKQKGILTQYYISPLHLEAWKETEIKKKLNRDVDDMYVILPLKDFYETKT
jgi:lipid-A-disaccharide synthase